MTGPFGPGRINTTGWPFLISADDNGDTSLSDLNSQDQTKVVDVFKNRFIGTAGSGESVFTSNTGPLAALFGGLPNIPGASITVRILAAIAGQLLGVDPTSLVTGTTNAEQTASVIAALEKVPFLGDIVEAITGVEDGDLTDLGTWANNQIAWLRRLINDVLILLDVFHVTHTAVEWNAAWADLLALLGATQSSLPPTYPAPTIGAGITAAQDAANAADNHASNVQSDVAQFWDGLFVDLTKVAGFSGNANQADTWQQFLDFIWPGGSGRSIADVKNVSTTVANTADTAANVGNDNATVLAFRGGQPTWKGMDQTGQVTFPIIMFTGATVGSFGVTRTTATMGFIPIDKSATIGSVYWFGCGTTAISTAHLTFYKMNSTTGNVTKVVETGDVSGFMTAGSTLVQANYDLSGGEKFNVVPGDVVCVELKVVGTGTHTVAGLPMNTPTSTSFPSRHAAVRDSNAGDTAGVSPSSIAHGSVGYTSNVPWFEIGIADGDVAAPVYTPRTFAYLASDVFAIPPWALIVDIICMGGGQGGGDAIPFAANGTGGNNGNWGTATYHIGTDIPLTTTSLAVTVGAGGARTTASGSGGHVGGNSTVTGTGMTTVTGTGGSGGNPLSSQGVGDDDRTYNGVTYVQGNSTPNAAGNAPGNTPGGGGQGGNVLDTATGGAAGNGARGQVWIVARTS